MQELQWDSELENAKGRGEPSSNEREVVDPMPEVHLGFLLEKVDGRLDIQAEMKGRCVDLAQELRWEKLREVTPGLDPQAAALLGQVQSLLTWQKSSKFDASSGSPTVPVKGGYARWGFPGHVPGVARARI